MSLKLKTFDTQADFFEDADGAKQEAREEAKLEKENQLLSKRNSLKSKIRKKESELNKSVVSPQMDTLQIALDLELLKKEKSILDQIIQQIFPVEVEMK